MQEQIISLAVYLEDSDLENGCFQLIPGNDTPYGKLSESNELFLRSTLHGFRLCLAPQVHTSTGTCLRPRLSTRTVRLWSLHRWHYHLAPPLSRRL